MAVSQELENPGKTVNLSRMTYENAKCHVLHKRNISHPIDVSTGVRQGCVLFPTLFSLVPKEIMKKLTKESNISWALTSKPDDVYWFTNTNLDLKFHALAREASKC